MTHKELMKRAIELATENVSRGGGPFGAVIARNGNIIAEGVNRVTANHDPTAHAEVQAIRAAASNWVLSRLKVVTSMLRANHAPCAWAPSIGPGFRAFSMAVLKKTQQLLVLMTPLYIKNWNCRKKSVGYRLNICCMTKLWVPSRHGATTTKKQPTDMIDKDLKTYIESSILPQYDAFDTAHRRNHAEAVIRRCMDLAEFYPEIDRKMLYVAAACHDLGLCQGRDEHHKNSAHIIRADRTLSRWFSETEISIIAEAAEDHRASLGHAPRTLYGRLVAEADRLIDPDVTLRRTVQYGLSHYPELPREAQYTRFATHLKDKYAPGGYLQLWIPESPNSVRLEELRHIISDEAALRNRFDLLYEEETAAL